MVRSSRAAPWCAAATALTLALTALGCGDDDFANEPRPVVPLTVSVAITPQGVTASPARFGAGTIELLVSNQTATSRRLRLRSRRLARGGRELTQTTGPISPGATASLKADVDRGTYVVGVGRPSIPAATVIAGAQRDSSPDRSLQP